MERKDDTSLEAKIISLPASVERRQSISDQMSRLPIKWSFFDALTSDSFSSNISRLQESIKEIW